MLHNQQLLMDLNLLKCGNKYLYPMSKSSKSVYAVIYPHTLLWRGVIGLVEWKKLSFLIGWTWICNLTLTTHMFLSRKAAQVRCCSIYSSVIVYCSLNLIVTFSVLIVANVLILLVTEIDMSKMCTSKEISSVPMRNVAEDFHLKRNC